MRNAWNAVVMAGLMVATSHPALAKDATAFNSKQRLKEFSKLPDWSGAWEAAGSIKLIETTPAGITSYKDDPRTRDRPPYNTEWEQRYVQALPRALKQGSKDPDQLVDSYTRFCAAGALRLMASPFPLEFAITPEQTWIVAYASEVRHIYTGAYAPVSADAVVQSMWGYSTGHWHDGALSIDTVGLKSDVWLDTTPIVLSDKATLHEELHQIGPDLLQDDITISDPVAFTVPWQITRQYRRISQFIPGGEDTCRGADKDPSGPS